MSGFSEKQSVNLALTVLEVVSPVFLLAAIGFVWVRAGVEYRVQFVAPAALATLSLATVLAYGGVTLASAALVWLNGLEMRTFLAPVIFGNTGNLGLPLAMFAFGELGLGYAVVVFAIMAIWSFTFGIWVVSGGGALDKVLREPLVWATLLGGLFLWNGWETPTFLTNTLTLIGQMAIPLMLITLGVAVARLTPGRLGQAVLISLAKLVLCTAIAWTVGRLMRLDDVAFAVLVLQVATPVAVTSYLLAEKYGADAQSVASLVVVSTLISVGAIPVILAVLL